jgi:phosphocarrier protein
MSISCEATVKNSRGIHARPSSEIAKTALKYQSDITIKYEDRTANAKDVLQLIMLELFEGSNVIIEAEGEDEEDALEEIKKLVEKEYNFD